ncbi:MAG: arylsulfatase [Planctomycetaceae bacterium]|nr:arylsulfatase [Planctomycetaceae bacterium]
MRQRGTDPLIVLAQLVGIGCVLGCLLVRSTAQAADRPPNIVIIFTDDQGYGDVGVYGARGFKTPHLDRMAREGMRFTDFYVAQPVCSSSRVALLTGCYPNRLGIVGALSPRDQHGIHDDETTLGELCRSRGYATAIFGKWHLGHHPRFLPLRHGFDEYLGLPYSNDMWPHHPTAGKNFPDLPLIDGDHVAQLDPDQSQLTTWYTQRSLDFIEKNKDRPFFLYVPHSMPHVPLHVSDKFKGKSERGLFGDVIEEIDWSVGEVLAALHKHDLDDNTLVLFTCDNGPWLSYGNHAGSAGPLREGKATTFEGGVRVPLIARWPGKISADAVCSEPAMTIDLFPTIARLIGATLPERHIDGLDIWPLLAGEPGARSPHDVFYFYWLNRLDAVRRGKWKLHLPHDYTTPAPAGSDSQPGVLVKREIELSLFDLFTDIGESTNVAAQHPEIVAELMRFVEQARDDLGDSASMRVGKNVREPGRISPDR